ncbi:hypothetical protein EON65_55650 [archaeon]|nr:MAG: hypothetical protein EON65_55650 [archaeon]
MSSSSDTSNIPRLSAEDRAQRLLSEINGKLLLATQQTGQPFPHNKSFQALQADNEAKRLLVDYTGEITKSIVIAASELASHRGSDVIEEQDIVLVLGKTKTRN